jgi:hypothetical protein
MGTHQHRRIGVLFFNRHNLLPDIKFYNGMTWGGLRDGESFDILNDHLTWIPTRFINNEHGMYLQGFCDYIPLGVRVRI